MLTVAELPEFIGRAGKLLGELERQSLIAHLAEFPKSGVLIRGTGGIRKLRWARKGSGKSGGVRVVYYFHDERIPLYLLTIFGKGEQSNLSQSERNDLARLVKLLVQSARL
jgi:hypothetical protein